MTMRRVAPFTLVLVLIASSGDAPPPSAVSIVAAPASPAAEKAADREPGDPFHYGEVTIEGTLAVARDASPDAASAPDSTPSVDAIVSTGLRDRLQRLGFDLREPTDGENPWGEDAAALLVHHRRGVWFDAETGVWPNEHDALAREIAAAVAPALAGASFSETPPDLEDEETPYRLDASLAGRRYSISAENYGDWYDIDAVVALLNTMLRDRADPQRLLVLATEDQTAIVVGGPASALVAAVGEGLLEVGSGTQATAIGKAFEQQANGTIQKH